MFPLQDKPTPADSRARLPLSTLHCATRTLLPILSSLFFISLMPILIPTHIQSLVDVRKIWLKDKQLLCSFLCQPSSSHSGSRNIVHSSIFWLSCSPNCLFRLSAVQQDYEVFLIVYNYAILRRKEKTKRLLGSLPCCLWGRKQNKKNNKTTEQHNLENILQGDMSCTLQFNT